MCGRLKKGKWPWNYEWLFLMSPCFAGLVQRIFSTNKIKDNILISDNVLNVLICSSPFYAIIYTSYTYTSFFVWPTRCVISLYYFRWSQNSTPTRLKHQNQDQIQSLDSHIRTYEPVPVQALMSPPPKKNYKNWPSIFRRPFLVVTLLNNNRHTVSVFFYLSSFHLHGPFT